MRTTSREFDPDYEPCPVLTKSHCCEYDLPTLHSVTNVNKQEREKKKLIPNKQ